MNLLSKKLVALATVTCLVSSSVLALTKPEIDAINLKMASVKIVEAPLTAAKLVTAAEKLDKEATAVAIVKSVAANQPAALKKVIVVVLTRVPEATDAVVRAALEVAPKSASIIVAAAAEANPSKVDAIANIARARVPSESLSINREIAVAQLHAVPVTFAANGVAARPTIIGALADTKGGGATVTQTGATFQITISNPVVDVHTNISVDNTGHTNEDIVTVTNFVPVVVTTTNIVVISQTPYGGADVNRP